MPQPVPSNVLLLSWRPKVSPVGADTKAWVDLFKQRVLHQCRGFIDVVDVLEPGVDRGAGPDRASTREGTWTDFLATFTFDYLDACDKEPDHELGFALHQLRDEVEGKRFWMVRLEAADPKDLSVTLNSSVIRPWAEDRRWHFLPEVPRPYTPADGFLDTARPESLSTATQRECIEKLKAHGQACPVCRTARRPLRDEPPRPGLVARLRQLFSTGTSHDD
jgi:hypothetical protein